MKEQQLFIVESLPNVGPVTARKLLEKFKSVGDVFSASADDLKKVEGIGDKIAKNIRAIIESDYLLSPQEFDDLQASIVSRKDKPQKEYQLKK